MNYLLIHPTELVSSDTAVITGERARYVKEFHNLKAGDSSKAILFGSGIGEVKCTALDHNEYTFSVQFVDQSSDLFPLTLIQGVCRPQTMKKVLQFGAMLRLQKIIFVPTALGQKSYRDSKIFQDSNQLYELVKGLEQIGNPHPPKLELLESFDDIPVVTDENVFGIVAEPDGGHSVGNDLKDNKAFPSSVLLALGPESGWNDKELSALLGKGYQPRSIGPDHYRVEVALVALLSQLKLWQSL